jgi:hypothetical protein
VSHPPTCGNSAKAQVDSLRFHGNGQLLSSLNESGPFSVSLGHLRVCLTDRGPRPVDTGLISADAVEPRRPDHHLNVGVGAEGGFAMYRARNAGASKPGVRTLQFVSTACGG